MWSVPARIRFSDRPSPFTATVNISGGIALTRAVSFYAGGAYLGPGALNASGMASFWPRIRLRLCDVDYQYWPGFTYGSMPNLGVSVGIRYRIR